MARLSAKELMDINLRNHGRHTSNLERFLSVDRLGREAGRLQAENEELREDNEALRGKLFNAEAEKIRGLSSGDRWRREALDRQIALQDAQMDVDRLNHYCGEENKKLRGQLEEAKGEITVLRRRLRDAVTALHGISRQTDQMAADLGHGLKEATNDDATE